MTELVVGADIGGTATRVGVADLQGQVVALATGGPGNPNSVGIEGSATEIRSVMDRALTTVRGEVVAVVLGLAGGAQAAAVPGFLRAAVSLGVAVRPALVSDLSVAFSSATAARKGYVLVAGTGAVAGQVLGTELVAQRDGWGWLLGDEGSGFWIGRAAVRATLDQMQTGLPPGPLSRAVLDATGAGDYLQLLQTCYSARPTWLASLSPLVTQHAHHDPAAARIASKAAVLLADLLLSLNPAADEPIVLAGSVLTTPGPVSAEFRARLVTRHDNPVLIASSGVVGALWIGLRPRVVHGSSVHRRLLSTARSWLTGS